MVLLTNSEDPVGLVKNETFHQGSAPFAKAGFTQA